MDNPAFEDISAGTVILRENAVSDRVFIIDEGEVEVLRRVEGKFREMRRLGPGDFFGELSLLEDLPGSDVVRAVSDCRLLTISKDLLPHVLRENIDVALLMIRRLSIRAEENQQLTLDTEMPPPEPTPEPAKELAKAQSAKEPEPAPKPEPTPEPAKEPESQEVKPEAEKEQGPDKKQEPDTPYKTAVVEVVTSAEELSEEASLLHEESGTILPLPPSEELTIGRLHIDFSPDIDLRLLDTQRSVSRLHAQITSKGDQLLLWENEERPTVNGTFVNGERLPPGQEHVLVDGDQLRFGTLTLLFRWPPVQRQEPQAAS